VTAFGKEEIVVHLGCYCGICLEKVTTIMTKHYTGWPIPTGI